MREHEAAQKAFYANKERLKALRLARQQQEDQTGEGEAAASGSR